MSDNLSSAEPALPPVTPTDAPVPALPPVTPTDAPVPDHWFAKAMVVVLLIFGGFFAIAVFLGYVFAVLFIILVIVTPFLLVGYVKGEKPHEIPRSTFGLIVELLRLRRDDGSS